MKKNISAGLLFALAIGSIAFGQDVSGTIGGSILDPSSSAVPNAKVTITDTSRNQVVRTVTTNSSGTYFAPLIPVGIYTIKVEAPGIQESKNALRLC